MIQEVKYQGLSSVPSDYESPDGHLAASVNLIAEDGHLEPLPQPATLFTLPGYDDKDVLCIHSTAEYTHYIVATRIDNDLYWVDSQDTSTLYPLYIGDHTRQDSTDSSTDSLTPIGTIYKITPIGNTLCVLCNLGMLYFLWTSPRVGGSNNYTYLSNSLPEINLSFGLQCRIDSSVKFGTEFHGNTTTEQGITIPIPNEATVKKLTENVLAKVNKLIAEKVTGSERFCMPFFVRYAFRLFDGSLTRQSAPILMIPNNSGLPLVLMTNFVEPGGGDTGVVSTKVFTPAARLDMQCLTDPSSLADYHDVIQSVDIFVSAPVFSYDPDGECSEFELTAKEQSFGIYAMDNLPASQYSSETLAKLKKYTRWRVYESIGAETGEHHDVRLKLPTKGQGTVNTNIETCSTFYFLASISLEDIATYYSDGTASHGRKVIQLDEGYLNSLVQHETLPDDFDSHDLIMPDNATNYNSRLILSGIRKQLFDGYLAQPYAETCLRVTFNNIGYVATATESEGFNVTKAFTYIRRNGRTITVKEDTSVYLPSRLFFEGIPPVPASDIVAPYLYHPDPEAFKVELFASLGGSGDTRYKISLNLKRHETLNGAVYFNSFRGKLFEASSYPTVTDKTISIPNRIYTSEVNNPFFFPVNGVVSVGNGNVLALSSAAKALSQGQFGQFPLYAFTTEGIWALELSNTGSFSARQPISRDVCSNINSITQIDSAVLFASDRGIMLISGSQLSCISDTISDKEPFAVSDLPRLSQAYSNFFNVNFSFVPFRQFIADCRMVYDYPHQHVIIFNPNRNYAYVYSLKSKQWGMMYARLRSAINSYPDALAMAPLNKLVSFSSSGEEQTSCMLVSRPLKLSAPDTLKTIYTLLQRGVFVRGDVATLLYGSRNLYDWHLVASSANHELRNLHGSPYKYFRIVALANLSGNKSLSGATIEFLPRHQNTLQ